MLSQTIPHVSGPGYSLKVPEEVTMLMLSRFESGIARMGNLLGIHFIH